MNEIRSFVVDWAVYNYVLSFLHLINSLLFKPASPITHVINFVHPIIISALQIQPVTRPQRTGRLGRCSSSGTRTRAAIARGEDPNIRPCGSTMLLAFSSSRV